MYLFKLGDTDYTQFIKYATYNVNEVAENTEWTDGYNISHRSVKRQKVSGNFTLWFHQKDDVLGTEWCNRFINYIRNNTTIDGWVKNVSLYVNNRNMVYEKIRVYIDFAPADELPSMDTDTAHTGYQVTITQK